MIILACVFFGVVLGMQESIYRAVIADMTPLDSRGTAYGIFNTVYGLGLLGGGVVYGLFINYGTVYGFNSRLRGIITDRSYISAHEMQNKMMKVGWCYWRACNTDNRSYNIYLCNNI
jgi:hypothetical protein